MTIRSLAAVAVLAALAGCATTEKYDKMLAGWVGASELDLVRVWGPPADVYVNSNLRFLSYEDARTMVLPGMAPSYTTNVIGSTAYTSAIGGSPAMSIGMRCSTIFELTDGKVTDYRFRGNDCKAK